MKGKHIPSVFTLGNLVFGVIAMFLALNAKFMLGGSMILVSMVMDFFDGKVARKLQVSSEFGRELDSLADLVSFGVAPAILTYALILKDYRPAWLVIPVVYVMCGALRLARFNVMHISGYFLGVPITAAGGIMAILVILSGYLPGIVLPLVMIVLAYLMISKIRVPKL